jgi:lipopolysaccharide export LptBFGC system permease protein LptF
LKLIEKYLVYEWLKWFCLCFLVLFSLLFLQFLNDKSGVFLHDSFVGFFLLFGETAINYLTWLFPISCFVATLFTFSFLSKNRELLALDASGISFFLIARPIIGLALICSAFSWISKDSDTLIFEMKKLLGSGDMQESREFSSFQMSLPAVNRTWYLQSFDMGKSLAHGIHLYSYDKGGNDLFRIRAESGFLSKSGWQFQNGIFLGFSSGSGIPVISTENQISWQKTPNPFIADPSLALPSPKYNKRFAFLELPEVYDDPKNFALLKAKPDSLSFSQLDEVIQNFPREDSQKLHPYRLRRAQIFWNAPGCLFAVICALALTLKREPSSTGFIIGLSLMWILGFYILRSFFSSLGERGILSAWSATGIPYLSILGISFLVLWKNR